MKKQRPIDPDALESAERYVETQLATMAKYGDAPTLTVTERWQLIRKCAEPIMEIRRARKTSRPTTEPQ